MKQLASMQKSLIAALSVLMIGVGVMYVAPVFMAPAEAARGPIAAPSGIHADSEVVVIEALAVFTDGARNGSEIARWTSSYEANGRNPQWLALKLLDTTTGKQINASTSNILFVERVYYAIYGAPPNQIQIDGWVGAQIRGITRAQVFDFAVRYAGRSDRPSVYDTYQPDIACAGFTRGGSAKPLCKFGTKGIVNDVVVASVPGTNIVVNKQIVGKVASLRAAASKAGYNLQATPSVTSRYPSLGSYRSAAGQQWLRDHGYPAASSTSNHQWGLAIDFQCNGKPLASQAGCMKWMKANAGKYGFSNAIMSSEPWHWSTTGR